MTLTLTLTLLLSLSLLGTQPQAPCVYPAPWRGPIRASEVGPRDHQLEDRSWDHSGRWRIQRPRHIRQIAVE